MWLHALADELGSCGQDEITLHALPHKMKFVVVSPHISSRTVDGVFLLFYVVSCRAGLTDLADVALAVKDTHGFSLGRYRGNKQIEYGEYNYKVGDSVFHR